MYSVRSSLLTAQPRLYVNSYRLEKKLETREATSLRSDTLTMPPSFKTAFKAARTCFPGIISLRKVDRRKFTQSIKGHAECSFGQKDNGRKWMWLQTDCKKYGKKNHLKRVWESGVSLLFAGEKKQQSSTPRQPARRMHFLTHNKSSTQNKLRPNVCSGSPLIAWRPGFKAAQAFLNQRVYFDNNACRFFFFFCCPDPPSLVYILYNWSRGEFLNNQQTSSCNHSHRVYLASKVRGDGGASLRNTQLHCEVFSLNQSVTLFLL